MPVMAASAGAGAPGAAAAASAWFGKESKFWKDILKSANLSVIVDVRIWNGLRLKLRGVVKERP